jgi:hypothetical protein
MGPAWNPLNGGGTSAGLGAWTTDTPPEKEAE